MVIREVEREDVVAGPERDKAAPDHWQCHA